MPKTLLEESELINFSKNFNNAYEDDAVIARGEFLRAYPLNNLKNITLDEYIIGKGTPTFCAWVEPKTKAWANIMGATALKFGIYYGRTESDAEKKYRFAQKFGASKKEAFDNVKDALLSLINAGKLRDFENIDRNPLSQMFKAKILSLYFHEIYLNVCSDKHLKKIASKLQLPHSAFISEYQNLLYKEKLKSNITKDWSNPKFMAFLYVKFIRGHLNPLWATDIKKPRKKKMRRKVNFEDLQVNRGAIGKISEEFAIAWEKDRLVGLGYEELVQEIKDMRDTPSYGYDFLSFSAPGQERYIEVKSVGFDKKEKCFRFFLSENERAVSESNEHCPDYYFYLVRYDKDGKPQDLLARHVKDVYSNSDISPCAYIVRFDIEDFKL
ncbi:MAG: DUF3883 domain-containing protein [Smithellaceae bacterium]